MRAWPNLRKMLSARGYDPEAMPNRPTVRYLERTLLAENKGFVVLKITPQQYRDPPPDGGSPREREPVRHLVGNDVRNPPLLSLPKQLGKADSGQGEEAEAQTRAGVEAEMNAIINEEERQRIGPDIALSFLVDSKIGVDAIRSLEAFMRGKGIARGIVLACGKPTPKTHTTLGDLQDIRIEVLCYKRYAFNLPDHARVPVHRVFTSRTECATFFRMIHVEPDKLPRQSKDDPVSQYYGLMPGDVVRYIRPTCVYHRVVWADDGDYGQSDEPEEPKAGRKR
jgi:DNA-directed RNA polymerase subunit H (RpoH/RPB5)